MAERHGLVVLSPASGVLASLASRPTEELLDTLEGLERSVRWTWLGKGPGVGGGWLTRRPVVHDMDGQAAGDGAGGGSLHHQGKRASRP